MQPMLGRCFVCDATLSKDEAKEYLVASRRGRRGSQPAFLLLVEDGYFPETYWLFLEIARAAKLADLDDYLRRIWLECCGHFSKFEIGDKVYGRRPNPSPVDLVLDEQMHVLTMDVRLDQVLEVGQKVNYAYDEVWPSELQITVLAAYDAKPMEGVRLLARNYKPPKPCRVCGKPAEWLYTEPWPQEAYCEEHARAHPAWSKPNAFLPYVNSPRVGLCVYRGTDDQALRFEVYPPEQDAEP